MLFQKEVGPVAGGGVIPRAPSGPAGVTLLLSPFRILGPPPLEFLTTGETHALGLDKDGKIWTWGLNDFGQRGLTGFNYTTNPTL